MVKKINILSIVALIMIMMPFVYSEEGTLFDSDTLYTPRNEFLSSQDNKLSLLIPALMLMISIVAFAIDFGVVGVVLGCVGGLFVCFLLGIIAISVTSIISLTIMGGIILFKVTR